MQILEKAHKYLGVTIDMRRDFIIQARKSAEKISDISSKKRLNFSNDLRQTVSFLVKNHMTGHQLLDEDRITPGKRKIFQNKNAEALLFINLADSMGNFSDSTSITDKVERFDSLWQQLQTFREAEKKNELKGGIERRVNDRIVDVFGDKIKNQPMFGKVQGVVGKLIYRGKLDFVGSDGEIDFDKLDKLILEIKNCLDKSGVDYYISKYSNNESLTKKENREEKNKQELDNRKKIEKAVEVMEDFIKDEYLEN